MYTCAYIYTHIHEDFDWSSEEFSVGAIPVPIPQEWWQDLEEISVNQLVRYTLLAQTEWSVYMDGAVEARERAAREVLHSWNKISQDQVWLQKPGIRSTSIKYGNKNLSHRICRASHSRRHCWNTTLHLWANQSSSTNHSTCCWNNNLVIFQTTTDKWDYMGTTKNEY